MTIILRGLSWLLHKIEWTYKKIFIAYIFNNWNFHTLSVNGRLNKKDKECLKENITFIDHVAKTYESLKHQENLINCLRLKYELLSFLGQHKEAKETAKQINNIIDTNDFNGLRSKHYRLVQGDTRYNKFVRTLAQRITEIWEIMTASGTEKTVFDGMPEELFLKLEQEPKWSIDSLFEFRFPS